ncbi:MAG: PBP1A family penicillin-binding protein [Actinomycetota bacterium]|nr:PBP1A family penicillin-binding protein [Actinomycetota bacterium]
MSRSRVRRARRRAYRKHRINAIMALCTLIVLPILLAAIGGFAAIGAILSDLPDLKNQGEVQNWQTTKIYASDGTLLTNLYYEQDRIVVPLSEVSKYLQQAVVAIEDQRFYKHKGYDPEAIMRAFVANLSSGHVVEGASTITQQYVKNTIITREKTFDRKIKEAALAYQLEKIYTKDQILEKYLNTIYFGQSSYGVETASLKFFGKRAKELSLAEAALLAGIIKSPNNFSPYTHPDKARQRRDLVIGKMLELKFITPEQAKQVISTPIQVKPISKPSTIAPEFVDYVKQELIKKYGENVVFKGGLRVYTTIDLKMQKYAEEAAWSTLNLPHDPSAAIVAIEPQTGFIKAMVGGRGDQKIKYNLVNSHLRQPGSAFKTFVYVTAIENGMSPFQTYESSPAKIKISPTQIWDVDNYVEGSGGPPLTIREALVRSVNTVYARLIMDVGPSKVVETAKRMGLTGQIDPHPAIALGGLTYGPSPLDMASAYSTLANAGKHCKPVAIIKVTDSSGKVLEEYKPNPEQVISEATAYIVTDTLQDVIRRGTGVRARINRPCAGKTGTASEYRDAWFCGYTPELSAAVWVGYPNGQIPMLNVHGIRVAGGTFPAQIWAKFMSKALSGLPIHDFSKPKKGIVDLLVCTETGLLANKYCPEIEYRPFVSNKAPKKKCTLHAKPSIMEIPSVVGLTEKEAKEVLDKMHYGHSITYQTDDKVAKGIVIEQTPAGSEKAIQGTVIQLVVSAGSKNQKIKVPDVIGSSESEAKQQIINLGLKVVDVTASPYLSDEDKQDKVVYQDPDPGTVLPYGQVVTIYVNRQ